jgi:hypothetical protein
MMSNAGGERMMERGAVFSVSVFLHVVVGLSVRVYLLTNPYLPFTALSRSKCSELF